MNLTCTLYLCPVHCSGNKTKVYLPRIIEHFFKEMTSTDRECGCKGHRTCLLCELKYGIKTKDNSLKDQNSFVYCIFCGNQAYPGWDLNLYKEHPNHSTKGIYFPGVYIQLDFLSDDEENALIANIDEVPWDISQSGRRKQNYGPKCNFKKRKIKVGNFNGFPSFSTFVQEKFYSVPIMRNFQVIEQCSLEYDPKNGASIDPHIDDCWVWGERIVTVNLMSDSVLTMTVNDKPDRYNLDCVKDYPSIIDINGKYTFSADSYDIQYFKTDVEYPIVRIPMPRKSLLIMYGSARYNWEHRILREDIVSRRVCLAYREFTPPFLEGGKSDIGKDILSRAKNSF